MARKTLQVTIDAEGRDRGKTFRLTEMPASQAEKWAARALMAMAKSGIELPDGIEQAGLAGVAAMGLRAMAGMSFTDAEPLMDEMMACVAFVPDPTRPIAPRALIEDDIEEVATRLRLRLEVFDLHTGFTLAASLSKSA